MTNKTSDYDLTVIVPVYNERGNMLRLETALSAFLKKSKVKSCILFVNDGSQDGSGDLIREICRRNKDFFYIGLAKNCGLSAAMKAGIDYTCSRLVGYIDADLQTTHLKISIFCWNIPMIMSWSWGFGWDGRIVW